MPIGSPTMTTINQSPAAPSSAKLSGKKRKHSTATAADDAYQSIMSELNDRTKNKLSLANTTAAKSFNNTTAGQLKSKPNKSATSNSASQSAST
jgi:hypothetical protein